jgi:hypothetical protein
MESMIKMQKDEVLNDRPLIPKNEDEGYHFVASGNLF